MDDFRKTDGYKEIIVQIDRVKNRLFYNSIKI